MSADLHIHALMGVTEEDLAEFNSNTLGSKWFNPKPHGERKEEVFDKIADTPQVWVGEVSWLKAALFEDPERYVPLPVATIAEIIGEELPMCDDALINRIAEAMALPNGTGYQLANATEVLTWLEEHKGHRLFTVSW